ncbi:hypothetical protein LCGC14_1684730 [marine sediment metagenome]|uniref:LamG-like jellyroll fold domain-containing protein n=1 Tax=marine sediment metagenome TaxID=412755 RepID=A0A0F9KMN8_9ZZZZ
MMKRSITILFLFCFCVSAFGQLKMFGQLPSGQYAEGLVFIWRGIEAGNVVDESFYRNHGTITGATWVGNGLSYNGTTDTVEIGTAIGKPSKATIIVRFAVNDWGNTGLVVESADNGGSNTTWGIRCQDATNNLEYWVSTGAANQRWLAGTGEWDSTEFPAGQFNTIAFTHDGSNLYYYKNGVQKNTTAQSTANSGSPTGLRIGKLGTLANWTINGIIEYVFIYDRALSATEIAALYINPDLPMQQEPIWQLFSPAAPAAGQVILITKAEQDYGLMLPWLMSEWLYPNAIQ